MAVHSERAKSSAVIRVVDVVGCPWHRLSCSAGFTPYLPDNVWNADTLFVLTPSPEAAEELAAVAKGEDWGGEVEVHADRSETDNALGTGRRTYGLVSVWWD